MMTDILKNVWTEWQIEKKLGEGSYGTVYKAVRRDFNVESFAAIKVISIPSHISELNSLRSEGLDMDASKTYFEGIVNDFVNEIRMMQSLKGTQNIVSVEDYKVVEKEEGIGWDIYIRMELLTPFNNYICDKKMTEEEAVKLGCDICTALEICSKRNIIHRDIKPENIFVNDFGDFKLGDFGIARKLENSTGGLSQKGTYNYMAPEVTRGNDYDARVDIYSLGIVLYRLLNDNRLPFLDTEKQLLNPNERRNAVERRIKGEALPPPCNASPDMADLILRACAFDPNQRFASASVMKKALMSISAGSGKTVSVRQAPSANDKKDTPIVNTFGDPVKKKSKLPFILTAVVLAAALTVTGIFAVPMLTDNGSNAGVPASVTIAGETYSTDMTGTLDLSMKGLNDEDIDDLKYMTNLTEIVINDNELIYPSVLGELTNLEKLTMHNNRISDISFVKNLTGLVVLGAGENNITDISPLRGLKELNELWLQNNAINDVSALSGHKQLKYASFAYNRITDFRPLAGNEFYELSIAYNAIDGNYEAVKGLTVTQNFYIGGNGISTNVDVLDSYIHHDGDKTTVWY